MAAKKRAAKKASSSAKAPAKPPEEPAEEVTEAEAGAEVAPSPTEARNAEIVGARFRGLSPEQIGRTYGISARRVRQIVEQWRKDNPTIRTADPLAIIDEMLEHYEGASEELALLSATSTNGPTRVGAINARMNVLRQKTELLQAIGALPHDLGKLRVELDVRYVAQTILTVLTNEGVPLPVQQKLMKALERGPAPGGNGASEN